ncbi:MAG: hypothetical protein KAH32_03775 [Chlamydiia bacterium]|nr:hypothetical protein [Chlamydiia bacterium]
MFKLGYKQTILNEFDAESMVIDAAGIHIEGFCDIVEADTYVTSQDPLDPAGGIFTIPTIASELVEIGETIKVSITLAHAGHGQGKNAETNRVTIISKAVAAADQTAVDTAIQGGYDILVGDFPEADTAFESIVVSGGIMTITIKDTSADVNVTGALYTVNKGAVAHAADITVAPETGVGKGWQVEQSVQLSTYYTRDPYRIKVNGADSVILEADYKTYAIRTKSVADGHIPAEGLGYGDMNTEAIYDLYGIVIFANVADTALTGALDTFVGIGEIEDSY